MKFSGTNGAEELTSTENSTGKVSNFSINSFTKCFPIFFVHSLNDFVSCRPMEEEAKMRMVPLEHSRLPTIRQVELQEVWQEVWSAQEQSRNDLREK